MIVENYRNEAVVISTMGVNVTVPPCSVRQFIGGVDDFRKDVRVTVKDEAGNVVYRTAVSAARRMAVEIPEREPGECPTPAETYMLLVVNETEAEVQVWGDGRVVGSVPARSRQRFGPLPGTWRDAARLTVRNLEGQEMPAEYLGLHFEYELGEVPEVGFPVPGNMYWPKK